MRLGIEQLIDLFPEDRWDAFIEAMKTPAGRHEYSAAMSIIDHTGEQIGVAEPWPGSKTDREITLLTPDGPWPTRQEHPFSMEDENGLYDGCWVASYKNAFRHEDTTILVEVVVQFTSGPSEAAA